MKLEKNLPNHKKNNKQKKYKCNPMKILKFMKRKIQSKDIQS